MNWKRAILTVILLSTLSLDASTGTYIVLVLLLLYSIGTQGALQSACKQQFCLHSLF